MKILKSIFIPVILVCIVSQLQYEYLLAPPVVFVTLIGILSGIFQPDYSPFKSQQGDNGTALQIIWTVIITQILALIESFYFNYPDSLEWQSISYLWASISLLGLAIRTWSVNTLRESFTMYVEVKENQTIIETGPYQYLAHPSYFGALLTFLANCLLLSAYISAAITTVFLLLAFKRRIIHEEATLVHTLGNDYQNYVNSRKRLLPFIW